MGSRELDQDDTFSCGNNQLNMRFEVRENRTFKPLDIDEDIIEGRVYDLTSAVIEADQDLLSIPPPIPPRRVQQRPPPIAPRRSQIKRNKVDYKNLHEKGVP